MTLISVCLAPELEDSTPGELDLALDGIFSQSYENFEVLLCLSEKDMQVASASQFSNDPRLRIIKSLTDGRTIERLNLSMQSASGSLVVLMSACDLYETHCFRTFARAFAMAPRLALTETASGNVEGDESDSAQATEVDVITSGKTVATDALRRPFSYFRRPSACCFRKEFASKGLDERFQMLAIFDFLTRVTAQGDFLHVSQLLVKFRKSKAQASAVENDGLLMLQNLAEEKSALFDELASLRQELSSERALLRARGEQLEQQKDQFLCQIAALEKELSKIKALYHGVLTSSSWKITAPIRKIRARLNRQITD